MSIISDTTTRDRYAIDADHAESWRHAHANLTVLDLAALTAATIMTLGPLLAAMVLRGTY